MDDRIIRTDWDAGFVEGRQYGRGKSGGQVGTIFREYFQILKTRHFSFLLETYELNLLLFFVSISALRSPVPFNTLGCMKKHDSTFFIQSTRVYVSWPAFRSMLIFVMINSDAQYHCSQVVDPHHFSADPDPTYHLNADPDPEDPAPSSK
jgi:hypothetical protein